jgi:putative hydrolase of the HAD superfamily
MNCFPRLAMRALIFDLDDTLLVDEKVSLEVLGSIALSLGLYSHREQEDFVRDVRTIAKRRWEEGPCYSLCQSIGISSMECLWGNFFGEKEWSSLRNWALEYRQEVFMEMLHSLSIAKECVAFFEHERRARQRLFPKAEIVLRELAQKYRLGLLTNGSPDLQREKLKASGLEPFFSSVIISGEHGVGKPEPAIFEKILKELGATASEAMMIGNSLERDIAGAHAAAIRSVWIDLGVEKERVSIPFDFKITDVSLLLTIVGEEKVILPA